MKAIKIKPILSSYIVIVLIFIPLWSTCQPPSLSTLVSFRDSLMDMAQHKSAISTAEEIVQLVSDQGLQGEPMAEALIRLGECHYESAELLSAIPYLERGINLLRSLTPVNDRLLIHAVRMKGDSYRNTRRAQQAESIQRENLEYCKSRLGEDDPLCMSGILYLAKTFMTQGRGAEAEPLLLRYLNYYQTEYSEETEVLATTVEALAISYIMQGDWLKAESYFKQCLAIRKQVFPESHTKYLNILMNLVGYYNQLGNPELALRYGLELATTFESNSQLVGTDVWFAAKVNQIENYLVLNRIEDAWKEIKAALPVGLEKSGRISKRYLHLLLLKGRIATKATDWRTAKYAFEEYLDILPQVQDENYDWGHLKIGALKGHGYVLSRLGEYHGAEQSYLKALNSATREKVWKEDKQAEILRSLVQLYTRKGEVDLAINRANTLFSLHRKKVETAYSYLSEKEKENFASTLLAQDLFFELLGKCYRKQPAFTEAVLDHRLMSKALSLRTTQRIRELVLESENSALLKTYDRWINNRKIYTKKLSEGIQIASLQEIKEQINADEHQLGSALNEFGLFRQGEILDWRKIRDNLKDDEAAIEIVRYEIPTDGGKTEVNYGFFVLRPGIEAPFFVVNKGGTDLEGWNYDLYISETTDANPHAPTTSAAYERFWRTLEPYLIGCKSLYVSLDGIYNKISLNSLQLPDGTFLFERYRIHHLNSLKEIVDKVKTSNNKSNLSAILVGNPDFNNSLSNKKSSRVRGATRGGYKTWVELKDVKEGLELSPLPYTEKEVEAIDSLLKGRRIKTTVLLGRAAREESIKTIKNLDILHLATHGFFLEKSKRGLDILNRDALTENPLFRSMLFLAGAQRSIKAKSAPLGEEDGILTGYEVMDLALHNTKLVVLSACQSGLGKVQYGEGVFGLQRAFKIAGAQNLIFSLWDVEDKATSELMIRFYENWLSGQSISEAFRGAQGFLKMKYKKPFFWAGFVLVN